MVLDRLFAKVFLAYLPTIPPSFTVSHEPKIVIPAHPEEVYIRYRKTGYVHGSSVVSQVLDRIFRSVGVYFCPPFEQLDSVLQFVHYHYMTAKGAGMEDAAYGPDVRNGQPHCLTHCYTSCPIQRRHWQHLALENLAGFQ